jgi:hypothetical protein
MSEKISFTLDKEKEEATLVVGEETYRISYDFAAIHIFYRAFGVNPCLESIGMDPARLAGLLWVGLLLYQPDVDLQLVRSWFTPRNMLDLAKATWAAFKLEQQPESEQEETDPPSA